MILRRIPRPQAISQQVEKASRIASHLQQRRSIHHVPHLGNNDATAQYFSEHGVPGFLSPKTFRETWTKYQAYLIDQINEGAKGTTFANKTPKEIHTLLSRNPDKASMYNCAAMAHFNHLWWEGLSPVNKRIPENLQKDIEEDFHEIGNLRQEMIDHASAMFGNGFVWLMKELNSTSNMYSNHTPLRIVCTYNAGSPYADAWKMKQGTDMATGYSQRMSNPQNSVGGMGQYSQLGRLGQKSSSQLDAYPILCLNVWQHMYVLDYGVTGKNIYLQAWWERIDWDVVYSRYMRSSNTERDHSVAGVYDRQASLQACYIQLPEKTGSQTTTGSSGKSLEGDLAHKLRLAYQPHATAK